MARARCGGGGSRNAARVVATADVAELAVSRMWDRGAQAWVTTHPSPRARRGSFITYSWCLSLGKITLICFNFPGETSSLSCNEGHGASLRLLDEGSPPPVWGGEESLEGVGSVIRDIRAGAVACTLRLPLIAATVTWGLLGPR